MTPSIIIAAINAVIELLAFINKASTDLKQSAELTPDEEAKLDAKIAALQKQAWWTPDAP